MADFEIKGEIKVDEKGFETAVKKAKESISSFEKSFDEATEGVKKGAEDWGFSFDKFYDKGSNIFKDFGIDIDKFAEHFGMSGKLLSGIVAVTVALEKFGEKIQGMNSEIVKGTGATGEKLQELKDVAEQSLINGVGRSAQEVGKMTADLNTRFNVTGKELTKLVDEFDMFSSVTGQDVTNAINSVADVMLKWNVDVSNSTDLLDQLTTASQMSGASVEELENGLKSGQAIFSQFGMNLTESISFLASLKAQGVDSANAITGLRTALAKWSAEGKNAEKEFKNISDKIKNASANTEALSIGVENFGSRSGAELVKVLRNATVSADEFTEALRNAGGALKTTDENSRTVSDALDDLKAVFTGTFGGFGEGIANLFKEIIDLTTELVNYISPIIEPLADIFSTVFTFIGDTVNLVVTNLIKAINEFDIVIVVLRTTLQNLKNTFRDVFRNIFSIFQTVFNAIFAVLKGDWVLAWENAKLALMKVADIILDVLSLIVNNFNGMINGVIKGVNKIIETWNNIAEGKIGQFLGLSNKKAKTIDPFENVDLSSLTGLTNKIKEAEEKIEELSGTAKNKVIEDLGEVTEEATEDIESTTNEVEKGSEKNINTITKFKKEAITTWKDYFASIRAELEFDAKDWSDVFDEIYRIAVKTTTEMLKQVGKDLVKGGSSWQTYASIALKGLAEVLEALSAQLSAMALVELISKHYGEAVLAGAGAVATAVASGAISAYADDLLEASEATEELYGETIKTPSRVDELRKSLEEINSVLEMQISDLKTVAYLYGYSYTQSDVLKANQKDLKNQLSLMEDVYNLALKENAELEKERKNINPIIYRSDYRGQNFGEYARRLEEINSQIEKNNKTISEYENLQKLYCQNYDAYISATEAEIKATDRYIETLQEQNKELDETIEGYKELYTVGYNNSKIKLIFESQMNAIKNSVVDVFEEINDIGKTIGEKLVDSIVEGATEEDFLSSMKDYLKEMIIKLTVWTDEFQNKLAALGEKIAEGVTNGFTENAVVSLRSELSNLFTEAKEKSSSATSWLDVLFAMDEEKFGGSYSDIPSLDLSGKLSDWKSYVSTGSNIGGTSGTTFNATFINTQDTTAHQLLGEAKDWARQMAIQGGL